uniref:PilZ domain-containing protein n=1 Tax=Desulfobacca acetoxidans TaxID=60893 RepID=A0A7V6A3V7_9BACT
MRVIPLTVQTPRRRVPRRAQRYAVNWAVTDINGRPARDSWLVDVSCMGARLDTAAALSPNMPIHFMVVLPDGETKLEVNGRVVWMRPVFATRGRYHQGIQFYGINWDLDRLARKESAG